MPRPSSYPADPETVHPDPGDSPFNARTTDLAERDRLIAAPNAGPTPTAGAYASGQVREAAVSYFSELVFRLDPQLSDRLRMAALARQRTPTALATELLRRGLEHETRRQRAEAALAILTPREREVARLTVGGHTNREIAQRLVISPETVKTHMRNLLGKFSLSSKAGLRLWLQELDRPP